MKELRLEKRTEKRQNSLTRYDVACLRNQTNKLQGKDIGLTKCNNNFLFFRNCEQK